MASHGGFLGYSDRLYDIGFTRGVLYSGARVYEYRYMSRIGRDGRVGVSSLFHTS